MAMKTDAAGQAFICDREAGNGPVLTAYPDSGGVWTIGFGTVRYPNGTPVKQGDTISPEQARAYFITDLASREAAVNALVTVPLTQPQFNALVSFVYNEGRDNFAGSTLLKLINQGRYREAAAQFVLWDNVRINGKLTYNQGLANRRALERDLFLSGTSQPVSNPQ